MHRTLDDNGDIREEYRDITPPGQERPHTRVWDVSDELNASTWHSSGAYLLNRLPGRGGLEVTPDYLRAFLARPELAPVDESCDGERCASCARWMTP